MNDDGHVLIKKIFFYLEVLTMSIKESILFYQETLQATLGINFLYAIFDINVQ